MGFRWRPEGVYGYGDDETGEIDGEQLCSVGLGCGGRDLSEAVVEGGIKINICIKIIKNCVEISPQFFIIGTNFDVHILSESSHPLCGRHSKAFLAAEAVQLRDLGDAEYLRIGRRWRLCWIR